MKYLIYALVLLVVQVLQFDNLKILQFERPIIVFFLLFWIPSRWNSNWHLAIAFAMGLLYDLFLHSPGIYTSAFLVVALLKRRVIIASLNSKESVDDLPELHLQQLGFTRYLILVATLSFAFHATQLLWRSIGTFDGETIATLMSSGTLFSIVGALFLEVLLFVRRAKRK